MRLADFTTAVCVVTVELELVRIVGPVMSVSSGKVMNGIVSLMIRGIARTQQMPGHDMGTVRL